MTKDKLMLSDMDVNKVELMGMISVHYNKETGIFYLAVPTYKDEESKEFLYNVIDELQYVMGEEGQEC